MFSVIKVREGLARDDYTDPGPYKHPQGTVAYEVPGTAGQPVRVPQRTSGSGAKELQVIKPGRSRTGSKHQH